MNKETMLAVVAVLKKRFNNLTAEELILLAADVIEAVYMADRPDQAERLR